MKYRGDVWWIDFNPSIGQEIRKKRPAIIVSNDTSNKYLNRYQVIPLSSNTSKLFPSEAIVSLNGKLNKAMADQLTNVSSERCLEKMGQVSPKELIEVERIIKLQLGID